MKRFTVDKAVFEKLPDYCVGVVAALGLDNREHNEALEKLLDEAAAGFAAANKESNIRELPGVKACREAFLTLGMNPNKFLCSIEALLTRIAKGKGFPCINAAVDLGNAISIGHRLPIGAHDIDSLEGGLEVRPARAGDTFVAFGETEEETPDEGEIVYASGSQVRTRRWTWRQSERGKITEETTAILYPIDGFTDVNEAEVKAAAAEFVTLLRRFFGEGVTIETGFVEREHPRFEFF